MPASLPNRVRPGRTSPQGLTFALVCVTLLAPTLVPIALWCGLRRYRRPNWPVLLVPLSLYGAALAFQAYSYASGSTFPFLRFYIVAIPLSACLAMLAVPDGAFVPATRRGRYAPAQPDSALDPPRRGSSVLSGGGGLLRRRPSGHRMGYGAAEICATGIRTGAVLAPDPDDVTVRKATEHASRRRSRPNARSRTIWRS